MRPRFLLDEQISRRVAEGAAARGVDVRAVDGSEREGADDLAIFRWAMEEGRILVTYNNAHFAPLFSELLKEGSDIPGLVFVSRSTLPSSDFGGLVKALVSLADKIEKKEVDPSGGIFLTRS